MELILSLGAQARILPCDAVLFDMDGTLVDSRTAVESIWRTWAARHGLDAEALLAVAHGRQNHETIRLVAPHLNTEKEMAFLVDAEESWQDGIVQVRGARELLSRLPLSRWAIVTSAWRRLAEIRLQCAALPMPRLLVTADDVPRSKPHPDGYLMAAARLGVDPSRCVVVEDAPSGIAAARAAGMTVVGMATTFPREDLDCEICIGDFGAMTVRATPSQD
jgi:sugar-phosphatase